MMEDEMSVAEVEDDFFIDAVEGMHKCETEWNARQLVFAWIDQVPTWMSAADWDSTTVESLSHFGPDCAKAFRIPHTLAAANKRLTASLAA
jgi:hypothetical protein